MGFQLGHHPAGNFLHVIAFSTLSLTIYPKSYRNTWKDVKDFYLSYLLGRNCNLCHTGIYQETFYWRLIMAMGDVWEVLVIP